jgi:hypothetical protein
MIAVDTNVLVYAVDATEADKSRKATLADELFALKGQHRTAQGERAQRATPWVLC